MTRKFRKVPKDKKTGVAKVYLSGAKNKSAKAAEIKRSAEAYRKGEYIDIKAVSKSRTKQNVSTSKKKKTSKRGRKKKVLRKKQREQDLLMDSLRLFIDAVKVLTYLVGLGMYQWARGQWEGSIALYLVKAVQEKQTLIC